MKNKLIFFALFFFCAIQFTYISGVQDGWFKQMMSDLAVKISALGGWAAMKELPKQMVAGQVGETRTVLVTNVSDVITDAVYQAYPRIKQQVIDWVCQQISSVKEQAVFGLMFGAGVAATGLTIFVMYKIYDKYLRHELTKEQTEQEVADAVYAMVMNDLAYPTYSSKIHVLLKKDEFLNYLEDTDAIFSQSCNKAIAKITENKNNRDTIKDAAIDAKMNELMQGLMRRQVSIPSNEEKLKYFTDTYIKPIDKFIYTIMECIEEWTIKLLGTALAEKDITTVNERITYFRKYLLDNLTVEQRAVYSLYLRLKNKIAVEKLLTPEQKVSRDPFKLQGVMYKKPIVEQVKKSTSFSPL